ncbi:hypothetical protein PVAND_012706 [Polypedilum vanderplanki]|uniref:Uncharacterized protein n=1 Tax=Polypedilum vanderplanki TaxID=319348 RepID=A0A9J6CN99_POLVA|nr:hypothetical protein PVAND_012706 [Polypedilum vanderplanki]
MGAACKCCGWTTLIILIGIGIAGYIYRDEVFKKYNQIKNNDDHSTKDDVYYLPPPQHPIHPKLSESSEESNEETTEEITTTSTVVTTTTTTLPITSTQIPITIPSTRTIILTTSKPEIDHSGDDQDVQKHENYDKSKGNPEVTDDEDYKESEEGSGFNLWSK